MKTLLTSIAILTITMINLISMNTAWVNKHGTYWTQADRSSTIEAKSEKIKLFYDSIVDNREDFYPSSSFFVKNSDNMLDNNMQSLKTLVDRLQQIQQMNPSSLEYQTAIKQITENEIDQASEMIGVIRGCWEINNYFVTYLFGIFLVFGSGFGLIFGLILIFEPYL